MRFGRLFFLGCAFFCAALSARPYLDFVVDIDRFLIYPINYRMRQQGNIPAHRILTATIDYRIADWAEELVEALLSVPDSRVSFFSADQRPRNETVLRSLKLSDGRTVHQAALEDRGRRNGALLSWDDLTFLDEARKSYRKDIRKAGPDVDLDYAFLLDDSRWAPLAEQLRNLIRPESFWAEYIEDPTEIYVSRAGYDLHGAEGELQLHFQERNALVWVMGVIDRVMEEAERRKIPPVQALAEIHWKSLDPKAPELNEDLVRDIDLYRRGLRRLKAVNPKCHFAGLDPTITLEGCGDWTYIGGLFRPR